MAPPALKDNHKTEECKKGQVQSHLIELKESMAVQLAELKVVRGEIADVNAMLEKPPSTALTPSPSTAVIPSLGLAELKEYMAVQFEDVRGEIAELKALLHGEIAEQKAMVLQEQSVQQQRLDVEIVNSRRSE